MADAYGKLTGRPAAAFVTRGPGACHGAIGVHIAMQDSTPMLLFVGQIPFEETDRESFQEIDYRRMFGPLAKWVTQIDEAKRIPEIVAHAVDVATSGRPGPVVIALSEEMQRHMVGRARPAAHPGRRAASRPGGARANAGAAGAARRPLGVLGGSCWTAGGAGAIRDFLLAQRHPGGRRFPPSGAVRRHAGQFRRRSRRRRRPGAGRKSEGGGPDPGDRHAARRGGDAGLHAVRRGAASAPIVHVYPEGGEIGRVFRPALGIVPTSTRSPSPPPRCEPVRANWDGWTEELRGLREAQREVPDYAGALNLGHAMRELERLLAPDAIVTTDAGNFAGWPTRFMNFGEHQRYIGPTNGAMGYSVPAAVGAKIAFPDRMVVSFVGDGGFLMTGQEIATAFHHGVAPIVLVFNNAMYGTMRMYQERAYPGRVSGTALDQPGFRQVHRGVRRPRRGGDGDRRLRPGVPPRRRERPAGGDRVADEPRADHHARYHRRSAHSALTRGLGPLVLYCLRRTTYHLRRMGRRQAVRHRILIPACGGSNPPAPAAEPSPPARVGCIRRGETPMSRTIVTAALSLWLAVPLTAGMADAAETEAAKANPAQMRDFTLRNETDQTIVDAHARTKTGKDINVTALNGQIASREGQNFPVDAADCLESVQVKFKDGRTLARDNLNDCKDPRIVARNQELTVETGAGGPLHVPGGHDEVPGKSPPVPSQQRQ